jgi:hypothetical protein
MAKRLSASQRREVLALLAQGQDRKTIAARVGVTPGQVSAINAHVTMGTYELDSDQPTDVDVQSRERAAAVLKKARAPSQADQATFEPVLIGNDSESGEPVYWNPDPNGGAANPHVLVLGESGFGKTYAICCLLTELAQRGITSIVFDYAQGFSLENSSNSHDRSNWTLHATASTSIPCRHIRLICMDRQASLRGLPIRSDGCIRGLEFSSMRFYVKRSSMS